MKISFASTKKKIALLFAISLSTLILLTTATLMILTMQEMDLQAKDTLQKALKSTIEDFEEDLALEEIDIKYQTDNKLKDEYVEQQELPNINIQRSLDKEKKESFSKSNAPVGENSKYADFNKLQENHEVFSRVTLPNGDILFSSDLFDSLFIDVTNNGFLKQIENETCVYVYTSTDENYIVQTAQYCPFTPQQQRKLILIMLLVTAIVLISTYFAGIFVAGWLLKPLQKSITQTKKFAQNCHHELLTPITVALSSAEAAQKSKEYEKGIHSIKEDLAGAYESLKLLSSRAFHDQAKLTLESNNISKILNKALKECVDKSTRKDIILQTNNIQNNIIKDSDKVSVKLIFQNLIGNALKYTSPNGFIKISLNNREFIIENSVEKEANLNVKKFFERHYRGSNGSRVEGKGLGLSIVKELAGIHDWNIFAQKSEETLQVAIKLKEI